MFKITSSKSKASSSSRDQRQSSRQGGDRHGKKAKRKQVTGSTGEQDDRLNQNQNIDEEEYDDYGESQENVNVENENIPRTVNDMQIQEPEQGEDEIQVNEYKYETFDTKGASPQSSRDIYHGSNVLPQNNPPDSEASTPQLSSQSRPQGVQSHMSSGSQQNFQSYYQAPPVMQTYAHPPGQGRSMDNTELYAPSMSPGSDYGYIGNPFPQVPYQKTATGRGSAMFPSNIYQSSPAPAAGQFSRSADSYNPNYPSYSRGDYGRSGPGVGGTMKSGRQEHYAREKGGFNLYDQAVDDGSTNYSSSSPPDKKDSRRDAQSWQELEDTSTSMANLALAEEYPSELKGEDSAEMLSYGADSSGAPLGSLGSQGQQLSNDAQGNPFQSVLRSPLSDELDLPRRQYKPNPSRKLPILDDSFKVHLSKSFKKGKVFKCLWSEPIGIVSQKYQSGGPSLQSQISEEYITNAKFGESAFHRIRRFVIVKERKGFSLCVPILTYRSQGTNKSGAKAYYHAMIYTGREAPSPLPGEQLVQKAVRMELSSRSEKLEPESRVNYAKLYTIEHNIKVCFIGKIHDGSQATFETDFKKIDSQDVDEN